jgi:hypothetical protein
MNNTIDTCLAALHHGRKPASKLRGSSMTCTMRVVISAMRMVWGTPLGKKI